MLRELFNLFRRKPDPRAKASHAAQALNAHRLSNEDAVRQALIDKLCGELGRPPIKLIRR